MRIVRSFILTTITFLSLTMGVAQTRLAGGDFEKSYKHGIELFQVEKYTLAKREFQRALTFMPIDKRGRGEEIEYYIAASEALGGGSDAEKLLNGFVKKYPHTIYANKVHLLLANIYQSQKSYEKSIAEYRKVNFFELSESERAEYFFNLGYAQFSQGDYTEAFGSFRRVGSNKAYASSAKYYIAYIDYVNNDLVAARREFVELRGDKTYATIVPFYILHIDYNLRDYRSLVKAAPEVLASASDTRRGEILRIAANSHYELGEYADALRYFDAYIATNPELTRNESYLVGYCAYMTGDFERAITYLGTVAAGDDILAQNASFHIGSAALRMGDKQRAKQAFSLAMRMDEDRNIKEQAMFNFAKLQYELGGGMFDQTINTLTTYINEFPDSPNLEQARQYLMAAYLNSRNYSAAYDAVSKIKNPDIETKSALQRIAYYRGLEYFMDKDYAGAQKMFDIASANRYNAKYNALTKFWMAEIYYRQGQYSRAIPLYQDYIVLSPKGESENTMTNYNIAYCHFNLKNMREAAVWFNRFIAAYSPNDKIKADSYNRIGDIQFLNKEYAKAIETYDKAIKIGGTERDYAQFQRALALGLTSGTTRKIDALNGIINENRSEYVDDAMYELGNTYTKNEQFDKAAATLKSFVSKFPTSPYYPNALCDLGLIYQNMGKNNEALDYYKTVVSKFPSSPQSKDALLGIKNIYVDGGDLSEYFAFASRNSIETNVSVVEKDSLTFAVAERIYLGGDQKRAQPLLQTYLSQFPRGGYIPNATFYLAECNAKGGNTAAAMAGYESVVAMSPNPFTANALQGAADLNFKNGNFSKAEGYYQSLLAATTNKAILTDALLGYVRSAAAVGNSDRTVEAARYAIDSPIATPEIKTEARFVLGKALLEKGENAKALAELRDVARNTKTRNGAEAQYLVIETLFNTGQLELVEKEVFKFSESSTPHQYWLGKAFLVLGDIYVKKGDKFQAKATYNSIVDGYSNRTDGVVEEAKNKLTALGK